MQTVSFISGFCKHKPEFSPMRWQWMTHMQIIALDISKKQIKTPSRFLHKAAVKSILHNRHFLVFMLVDQKRNCCRERSLKCQNQTAQALLHLGILFLPSQTGLRFLRSLEDFSVAELCCIPAKCIELHQWVNKKWKRPWHQAAFVKWANSCTCYYFMRSCIKDHLTRPFFAWLGHFSSMTNADQWQPLRWHFAPAAR